MINEKKILAVIPARGGSKRLARKNILNLAGKPLIAWSIEAAQQSRYIDKVILSSEDEEIIAVAKKWQCDVPYIRPVDLARDETLGVEPVLHALELLPDYDYVLLLQPTSPLRTVDDIDGCIEQFDREDLACCVSVTTTQRKPFSHFVINEDGYLVRYTEKKEGQQKFYVVNGAIYLTRTDWLLEHKAYITPETRAYIMPEQRSVDIDTELDFRFAEFLLKQRPD